MADYASDRGEFLTDQSIGSAECRSPMLTEIGLPELPEWLQDLYPFHTRTLRLGPYRLSLVDEGPPDAPAIVLLHGNATWSFLFRNAIRRLSSTFRVIAPDHIGFGLSDKPLDPAYHTLARHIENFTAVLEALQLKPFTLVAHGFGGPIGLGYATAYPANIARLMVINTWAGPLPNRHRIKLPLRLRIAYSGRIGEFLDSLLNLSLSATLGTGTARPLSDWTLEAYSYPFPTIAARASVRAFWRMFLAPDADTQAKLVEIETGLAKITARAEILWGLRDPWLTRLPAYLLRDHLRHPAEPVFFADAGHYLPEDLPDALPDALLRQPAQSVSTVFKILP